ncbi:MAG: exodeoxyribonuclease VII small subunit [Planctomycetota bacterium]|nr:exodeoxyribonuclease VII small subunit [Planctomycetota bacterium]
MSASPEVDETNAASGPAKGSSFEQSLVELEEIVAQLEAGEKPLDESLALYEKGVAALKRCHAVLDKAEKRIRELVAGAEGEPVLRDTELQRAAKGASPAPAAPAAPDAQDESETSEEQPRHTTVDAKPSPRKNVRRSMSAKPRPDEGAPRGGGSLFGSTQG